MRRYLFLLLFLIGTSALALCFGLRYSATTTAYHLLVLVAIQSLLALLLGTALMLLPPSWMRRLLHPVFFLNLLTLVLLELLILGSNWFWNKTITLPVLRNYFGKTEAFLDALPVQGWLLKATAVLLLLLVTGVYWICRPRLNGLSRIRQQLRASSRSFWLSVCAIGLLLLVLRQPLLRFKRIMHFQEEPVLQFALGNLWGKGNEVAFDRSRYELGRRDSACADSLRVPATEARQTVVIILLDALRADHLPAYGYSRPVTPFLDSLRQTGSLLRVEQAYSPSTNTVGGVAGLFFSRDWENFGYNGLNLMKYLRKAGFTNYAFLTGYHRDWFGLSALYRSSSDVYFESPQDPEVPPDDDLVTLDAFDKTELAPRSFLYIHLLSTHTIGRKHPALRRYQPDKIGIGTDQKTALINNYDNGILQADYVVRRIFDRLRKAGRLGNSIVYILADHGELFGEGGQWSHGGSVHPKLLQVPLLIYDPRKDWYQNLQAATLKDIAPTIAHRLRLPVPACWEGRSLAHPADSFRLRVNAVAECPFPLGLLRYTRDSTTLSVLNDKGQAHHSWKLSNAGWQLR